MLLPTLTARKSPWAAPLRVAQSNARAMSLTCMRGLQGVPSLRIVMFLEVTAQATKSLSTRSSRSLSLIPHAVANLRQVTVKFLSASFSSPASVRTFDFAYAVRGFRGEVSFLGVSSASPYMLQLDAKMKVFTPADLACLASSTLARKLMSNVISS